MVWQVRWLGLWVVLFTTAATADNISEESGNESCSQSSNDVNNESSNNRTSNKVTEPYKESVQSNISWYHPQEQDFSQYGQNVTDHRFVKCKQSCADLSILFYLNNTFLHAIFFIATNNNYTVTLPFVCM